MTLYTKQIWIVTFDKGFDRDGIGKTSSRRVAAYSFKEAIGYFNEEAQEKIIEVKKLNEEISYQA